MTKNSEKRPPGLAGLAGILSGLAAFAARKSTNPYYSGPVTDHFDGLRFYNPGGHLPKDFKALLDWQLEGGKAQWPKSYPSPYDDEPPERVTGNDLRVSFIGHASLLLQFDGLNILSDPVYSKRASPFQSFGPKRVCGPGVRFENLPPVDVVLLTHNHYDHMDLPALKRLLEVHDPLFVTPLGNDTILTNADRRFRTAVGDWGDTIDFGNDVSVILEPCHHWSARGITDRRKALWAAFVLEGPAGRILHVGDTGFHEGINYEKARDKYGSFRLANLPFGAYKPRDFLEHQHQDPFEAARAFRICNAAHAVGHHWGTFQLTNESIDDQLNDLAEALEREGISDEVFRTLRPGQVWMVPTVED